MARYLFIESRDPFTDRTVKEHFDLARDLAARSHQVELYLVQDAVLLGRKAVAADGLDELAQAGVTILADDFSLLQRGVGEEEVRPQCKVSPISRVVEALEADYKVIWN